MFNTKTTKLIKDIIPLKNIPKKDSINNDYKIFPNSFYKNVIKLFNILLFISYSNQSK